MRKYFLVLFTALLALTSLNIQAQYAVYLESAGENKVQVIKDVRDHLGLGLKDAKELVDSAPCILVEYATEAEANAFIALLCNSGATAYIYGNAEPLAGNYNTIFLSSYNTRVKAIIAVRRVTKMDLSSSMALVDSAPVMIDMMFDEAIVEDSIQTLTDAGITALRCPAGYCGPGSVMRWYRDPYGNVTVKGRDKMKDYNARQSPWYYNGSVYNYDDSFSDYIYDITIEEGITHIGSWSFTGTSISTITLPSSVKSIGDYAFDACNNLNTIYASSPLDDPIPTNAFGNWDRRSQITVYAQSPEALEYWSDNGFNVVRDYIDPEACFVWARVTVDGNLLDTEVGDKEPDYCIVTPYVGNIQVGEPTEAIINYVDDECIYLYPIYIDKAEANACSGQELRFVITSSASSASGEIEHILLPYDGDYVIKDVKLNGTTVSAPTIQPGTTYGTEENPYILNYITPTKLEVASTYTVNVGDTFTAEDLLDVQPANASIPFYLNWNHEGWAFINIEQTDMGVAFRAVNATGQGGDPVGVLLNDEWKYCFVTINDPANCTYIVTITADNEELNTNGPSEYRFIDVYATVNGVLAGEQTSCYGDRDYYIYPIVIDATQFAGQTVEFHVVTNYDDEIVGYQREIDVNNLPWSGDYIIRDVMCDNYTSTAQIPVTAGRTWGSALSPVTLNYVAPETVNTTPSTIELTVGGTFDLSTVTYDFQPANSTIPVEFKPEWSVGNYIEYMELNRSVTGAPGTILTGLAPSNDAWMPFVEGYTDNFHVSIPVSISEQVIPATGITVTSETQVVWIGNNYGDFYWQTQYLDLDDLYEIQPANATNQNVIWSTSDETIASILNTGSNELGNWCAVGEKVGTATITATTEDGNFSASFSLEVRSHVQYVGLVDYEEVILPLGNTLDLSNYHVIMPEEAYDHSVTWTSLDEDIVTVSMVNGKPTATAVGIGYATIKAVSNDNPQAEAYVSINVPDPNLCTLWFAVADEGVLPEFWDEYRYLSIEAYADGEFVGFTGEDIFNTWQDGQVGFLKMEILPNDPSLLTGKTLTFVLNIHEGSAFDNSNVETPFFGTDGSFEIKPSDVSLQGRTTVISYEPGRTWGTPEVPVILNCIPLTNVEVPSTYTLTVGESLDLNDIITYVPANASKPYREEPYFMVGNYIDFFGWEKTSEAVIHATAPTEPDGVQIMWYYADWVRNPITIIVKEQVFPVTGLTIPTENKNQIVWIGNEYNSDLFDWHDSYLPLDDLYEILPANATNQDVTWTSSKQDVISIQTGGNEFGSWYAEGLKVGNAVLTVTTDDGGFTGTVNVEVRSHVESVEVPQNVITLKSGTTTTIDNNFFSVLPANAYDKSVEFYLVNDSAHCVSLAQNKTNGQWQLTAHYSGQNDLCITSTENPQAYNHIHIVVETPVTGITATTNETQILWSNGEWVEGDNILVLDDLYRITPSNADNKEVTWKASNDCVEISGSGNEFGDWYAYGVKVGTGKFTVTTDDGGYSASLNYEVRAHVEGLEINNQLITVDKGSTTTLDNYFTLFPTNAYDKSVTWTVTDTATVVSVSLNKTTGKWEMKANRSGRTTLQVTSTENPQAYGFIAVEVESHVTDIWTTNETQILWVGDVLPLDDLYRIIPADAVNQKVTWKSSNPSVISYDGYSNEYGGDYAIANGAGTATLTVTTGEGNYSGTINVEVRAHVESIQLSTQAITLQRGSTIDLSQYVTVLPANAYNKAVTWTSRDASIVSVTGSTAVGNAIGNTALVVSSSDSGAQAILYVTVEAAAAGVYAVNPVQDLWIGENADLSIYFEPADATSTIQSWTSSAPSVVAISGDGFAAPFKATAKAAGTATLTVTTDNGQKATISVTVKAHVDALQLSKQSIKVDKGSTTVLDQYLTVLPAEAYDKSVTWSVTDTATVVSVSQNANGQWQMKANRSGNTTLQVTSTDNPQAYAFLSITVEAHVTGVWTTPETQILWVGDILPLSSLYRVIPADAIDQNVVWASSDKNIIEYTGSNKEHGGAYATAKGVGTATLTVTTSEGRHKGTIKVEVRAHVESITLSQQAITLQRGSSVDLSKYVTVLPDNAYYKSVNWTTGNASIVSVNGDQATANAIGTTALTVASVENPNITATLTVTVEAAAAGVYAVNPVQDVWIGEGVDLSIRFEPADATSSIKSWTSSNTNVVAIVSTKTGYAATAKAAGTATLTVTTDNGQTATIEVTVKAHVERLTLNQQALVVSKGTTTILDQYLTVLPANAYDKSVTWAVTDTATVVSVSQNRSSGKWEMKANRSGRTNLIVTSNDNPQAQAFISVTVESHVTGVKTTSEKQIIWVGETLALDGLYSIIPADAANKNVTWTSSNTRVVSITQQATATGQTGPVAKALAAGTATLTVTTEEGGFKGTINIEVRAHVESIKLSTQAITMQRGNTADLSQYVTVLPDNAYDKTVTWRSNDASIVSISGSNAVAKAIGTTTLTVTSSESPNITARLTVTVEAAAAGVYAVNPIQTVAVGDNVDLSIYFEPEDATSNVKSWTSSNPSVVAISGDGFAAPFKATAKAAGETTLTITTDNGQTATIDVTVCNALQDISLFVSEATLEKGTTLDLSSLIITDPASGLYDLTIEYIPTDGSDYHFSVDENGKVTALRSTCGDSYEVEIRVTDGFGNTVTATISIAVTVSVTGINLEYSEQSIQVNEEVNLGYTVTPADADLPDEEWSSSDESVVRVELTEEGWKAFGVGVGNAMVTLTLGDISTTIDVEVYAVVERIHLNTQSERIKVGETICLDNFIVGFEPEEASDKRVTWKADDEKIVSITQKGGKYYATGLAEGNTPLAVQSVANPEAVSYMGLTVITSIESIKAVYPEQYVYTDTYVDLSVEILPAEAADRYISWTLDDPEAGSFTSDPYTGDYKLQMTKYGDFTLTGTPDEGEHTCTILIHVVKHVEEIALSSAERLTVDAGKSLSLDGIVVFTPEEAYNKEVTWTSDNNSVATVSCTDGHWMVNGISSGLTTLNVTSVDNPKATARVEVSVIQRVTGITVDEPKQEIFTGWDVNMSYSILPADADMQDVTWTCSDENILSPYEVEDDYAYQGLHPGTATLTVTTDEGGYSATIEVTVRQGIEEVRLSKEEIFMTIGQTLDLDQFITDILPEDAYDKHTYWEVDERHSDLVSVADGHVATALAEGKAWVYVSAANRRFFVTLTIWIGKGAESLTVDEPNQTIRLDEFWKNDAHINLGYTILPESATFQEVEWTSTNPEIVEMGWTFEDGNYVPIALPMRKGTADLIASLPQYGLSDVIHVTVTVPETEWIACDPATVSIPKGETITGVIHAGPEYAVIDAEKLTSHFNRTPEGWTPADFTLTPNDDGSISYEVTARAWGEYSVQFDYPGTKGNSLSLLFGQRVELEKGWNWVSLARPQRPIEGTYDISLAFDSKLKDARTSNDLLYYDPEYGLFGTLTSLDMGSYKIEVTDDVTFDNPSVYYSVNENCSTVVFKDWNWMIYPYDTDFSLSELTQAGAFAGAVSGDRIVLKDGGFAEYDGSRWTGTLTEFRASEGYMYFGMSDHFLDMPSPLALGQKNDGAAYSTSRRTIVDNESIWQYNHRRFADNMTIIATLSDVTFPDDCTIGAFVNGECRGEGRYVDGKFFITVHGTAGETVSFIVHDDATDTFYTVPGKLGFDFMAGSLQHPIALKVGEKTTSIAIINSADVDGVLYDLAGRRVASPAAGYYIRNGKMILVK